MDQKHVGRAIRVVIAAPFREIVGIHERAAEYADQVDVCGVVSTAEAVVDQARLLQPEVLLLSEGLGVDLGAAAAGLAEAAPGTRLVVLGRTGTNIAPEVGIALRADASAAELRDALVTAAGRSGRDAAPPAAPGGDKPSDEAPWFWERPRTSALRPGRPGSTPPSGATGGRPEAVPGGEPSFAPGPAVWPPPWLQIASDAEPDGRDEWVADGGAAAGTVAESQPQAQPRPDPKTEPPAPARAAPPGSPSVPPAAAPHPPVAPESPSEVAAPPRALTTPAPRPPTRPHPAAAPRPDASPRPARPHPAAVPMTPSTQPGTTAPTMHANPAAQPATIPRSAPAVPATPAVRPVPARPEPADSQPAPPRAAPAEPLPEPVAPSPPAGRPQLAPASEPATAAGPAAIARAPVADPPRPATPTAVPPLLIDVPLPEPEAEPIVEQPRIRVRRPGRTRADTMLVFSGKGGVGKSVVATNLAVAVSQRGAKVALIDLNLQYGDVGVLLHVESHPTSIEALAQQGEQVDHDFLEEVMVTGAEEVRILLAPASPEFADLVTAASLRAILRELSRTYDYVIVDSPAHLEERILEVMEVADMILVVTSFNITSVKDTKVTLKLLQSLGIERDRVAVVLNQTHPKASFPREEIEKSLRFQVLVHLPHDPRIDDTIDKGRPMVLAEPRSEFAKQIKAIVDFLTPEEEGVDDGRGDAGRQRASKRRLRFGR